MGKRKRGKPLIFLSYSKDLKTGVPKGIVSSNLTGPAKRFYNCRKSPTSVARAMVSA